MWGFLSRWLLSGVVRSALAFESEAIQIYRGLCEKLSGGPLHHSLGHLLQEEELHWRILSDAAAGKLTITQLEQALAAHLYTEFEAIEPLEGKQLVDLGEAIARAREEEEKTYIFYSNLSRISKIPVVKKTFEVLAHMEKEHIDILRRLLTHREG